MSSLALDYFAERSKRTRPRRIRKPAAGQQAVLFSTGQGHVFANTKTGYRDDLGLVVRSGWEANTCRILNAWDISFKYEPRIFNFPIKRGIKAYVPDIQLTNGEWIEIKGYFDRRGILKIKRFKKFYPEEFAKLTMIISKNSKANREVCEQLGVPIVLFYEDLSHLFKANISQWEGR